MKKYILICAMMMFSVSMLNPHSYALVSTASAAEGNMAQVQLILKKLRSSMANMKDFDELEEAGMDKSDVDRLRKAMKGKIKQMTTDAVDLIRVL
ncbi:MAG TPA: hypothetical protein EYP39_07800 [Ghiorsea sp.]|nr:hypothetical protein [Ghiorsea sp.]HIP06944.1 hypothetical protein [Mariprofundaceae bacterium]